jgi:hypothetical protein
VGNSQEAGQVENFDEAAGAHRWHAARRHHVIEPYSLDIIPIPLSWKWLWSTGAIDQGGNGESLIRQEKPS